MAGEDIPCEQLDRAESENVLHGANGLLHDVGSKQRRQVNGRRGDSAGPLAGGTDDYDLHGMLHDQACINPAHIW